MVDVMRQLKPRLEPNKPNNNRNKNGNSPKRDGDNKESNKESSFVTQAKCFCCGKPGYRPKDCNIGDDIAQNEWFDRSGKVHYTKLEQNATAKSRHENNYRSQSSGRSGGGQTGRAWSMMQVHQSI